MPTGIIHVGGHYLEERSDYQKMGLYNTIWIDANDDIVTELLKNTSLYDGEKILHCLASDTDNQEMKFYVTNNLCSSSMLKLETHQNHYPHIKVIQVKEYKTKRLDTLFTENNISFTDRNFMNLDIQGAELLALKGCGKILDSVKYIYAEVNVEHLYENCCLVDEMDAYLKQFGFNRVEIEMTSQKWGDALYIR